MFSHQHKLVFVHHERTGGTSVETALRAALPGPLNFVPGSNRAHRRILRYKELFPDDYDECFRFCFVRNPWERVLSYYLNRVKRLNDEFDATAAELDPGDAAAARALARRRERKILPFGEYIRKFGMRHGWNLLFEQETIDVSGEYHFVGRYETLAADYQTVCDRLGIANLLPHVNGTEHAHYTEYYDDETRDLVAERCARDIELLGYRFGD